MTSSGFRPPHFSEDIAWLPAWLQPREQTLVDDQTCKAQENIGREDAGYNTCHLFLSGTDNTPVGSTPSGNLLHFHLHLSSNGTSQYTTSQSYNGLQTEGSKSNDMLSMQPQISTSPHEGGFPHKTEVKNDMSNTLIKSKSSKSSSPSIFKNGKSSRRKHQEKVDRRSLMNTDIANAVELSIAASEALSISELVNSASASEVFPVSSVLEVALRVKQARIQLCQQRLANISDCVTDVVDETVLLQDLDEDTMADACEDVGLSVKLVDTTSDNLCSSSPVLMPNRCSLSASFSRVLDTPISANDYGRDVEVQNKRLKSQEVHFGGICNQRKSEDTLALNTLSKHSPSESLLGVLQEKLSGDPTLVLDTFSADRHLEYHSSQYVQTNIKIAKKQGMNDGIANAYLLHTQESILSSSQILKPGSNVGAKDEVVHVAPEKFRSRWLGGWTLKNAKVSEPKDQNTVGRTTKFAARETSFISESVDIFPDENSLVKKQEVGPITASQSSVAYKGLCSTNTKIEFSQELMSSYNLSMADPLCSVVPCSISSEDANVNVGINKKRTEEETNKCLNPTLENGLEDVQLRTTGPHDEFGNGEGHVCKTNNEDSVSTTQRKLASLKKYSMIMPWNTDSDTRSDYRILSLLKSGNSEFLAFEENIDCFKTSSRKDYTSSEKTTPRIASCKDNEEGHEDHLQGMPITKLANQMEGHDETADREAELDVHHPEERSSPLVLNHRMLRRLRASKIVSSNDTGYVTLETASAPKELKTRDESGHKPHSGYRTRSSTRSGKRLKRSNHLPVSRKEENACLTSYHLKDRKRMMLQGLEFLLTGFSSKKERELEMMIRKHGGFIVPDVPQPPTSGQNRRFKWKYQQLPVMLSTKKLQTSKFLYGCAVNAFVLKENWLMDSIVANSLVPPETYMILPNNNSKKHQRIGQPVHSTNLTYIFDKVGIMLHGKHSFCTNMEKIIKHGGGQVFKTLQWLVHNLNNGRVSLGAIVIEDENGACRHLRHYALEQKLPMMHSTTPFPDPVNSRQQQKHEHGYGLLPSCSQGSFSVLFDFIIFLILSDSSHSPDSAYIFARRSAPQILASGSMGKPLISSAAFSRKPAHGPSRSTMHASSAQMLV
ncbi:hypothetical protein IFM89_021888 [Coptis chinensis]|uniref:BRCT domain-containing protein n=1 Tax=Coptis chinensis TaxID=261450 RepID=A0A835LJE3_9MAGN|nr:hypothetical protein IFM89_021888 [Coptis chinensis]